MSTAVIISGILRNTINASSSWSIQADYHLITENRIYSPQSLKLQSVTAIEMLNDVISRSSVKFSSINIINNSDMMFSPIQILKHSEFRHHPTIHMAFKWKWAHALLSTVQPTRKYNKILLLRPDSYLNFSKPPSEFVKYLPIPKHYHSLAELNTGTRYPTISDTCVMIDWEMFGIISKFFDYYVLNYQDTLTDKFDVHALLARYLTEKNVIFDNSLSQYLDYAILRDNTEDVFSNGKLKTEYSFQDLKNLQYQWWKETVGKKDEK